jgi:hypothetical protein
MANTNKNILITPSTGLDALPSIKFTGFDNNPITLNVLDSGTLSFSGSSGQLFSITDDLTGTIFSVNDITGIPSIEVEDTGLIKLAEYDGNVLIGTAVDNGTDRLQVNGSTSITGELSISDTGTTAVEGTLTFKNNDNDYSSLELDTNGTGVRLTSHVTGNGYLVADGALEISAYKSGFDSTMWLANGSRMKLTNTAATETYLMVETDGNVGIGTATPISKLDVNSVTTTTPGSIEFNFVSSTNDGDATGMQYGMNLSHGGARYSPQTALFATIDSSRGQFSNDYKVIHANFTASGTNAGKGSDGILSEIDIPTYNYQRLHAAVRGSVFSGETSIAGLYGLASNTGNFGGHFTSHGTAHSIGVYADAYLDINPHVDAQAIPLLVASNGVEKMRVTTDGDILLSGTVDGVDISAFKTSFDNLSYDNYGSWTIHDGLDSGPISSNDTLNIVGSGATSATYNPTTKTLTITSTDANTTYTTSAIDSGANAIIRLTGSDASTDDLTLVAGANISITPVGDNITIESIDTNTTYTTSVIDSGTNAIIRLSGSDLSNEDLTLVAGTNISITPVGDNITIESIDTNYYPTAMAFNTLDGVITTTMSGTANLTANIDGRYALLAGSNTQDFNTNNLAVQGNLTVQGTVTTVNSTTVDVADKNITLGSIALPTDISADGGGITLLGDTNKTILWSNATDSWDFNQDIRTSGSLFVNGNEIYNDGFWVYASLTGAPSNGWYFGDKIVRTDGGLQVGAGGVDFMINSAKDVGIGNSTPTEKLDVAGNIKTSGAVILPNTSIADGTGTSSVITELSIGSFDGTVYNSGKFLIQVNDTITGGYQISELLVVHNGTVASCTEYGIAYTDELLAGFDVNYNLGTIEILATATSVNTMNYTISKNMIKG